MKSIFTLLFIHFFMNDISLYNINIQEIDGNRVQMSSFRGKKIIIFAFNPGSADSGQLRTMDSVQILNPSLSVIAAPAVEFSDSASIVLINKRTNSGFSFLMTGPMLVLKNAGDRQDALFKWLSHAFQNTHFDLDVETEGQTYFISENGVLFAVMGKLTSVSDVENVLHQ